jgi:hypothetical protein
MVDQVTFSLEPKDTGDPLAPTTSAQYRAAGDESTMSMDRKAILWMSQVSTMIREDIKEQLSSYLDAYTGSGMPDYASIQATVLSLGNWYGFQMVLLENQVCLIHLLGKHSSGLGWPTPVYNSIFGHLGKKVGDQLPTQPWPLPLA